MAAFLYNRFQHTAKHRDLLPLSCSCGDIRDRDLGPVGNEADARLEKELARRNEPRKLKLVVQFNSCAGCWTVLGRYKIRIVHKRAF